MYQELLEAIKDLNRQTYNNFKEFRAGYDNFSEPAKEKIFFDAPEKDLDFLIDFFGIETADSEDINAFGKMSRLLEIKYEKLARREAVKIV